MNQKQVIRRINRRQPEAIAAVKPSVFGPVLGAAVAISGIIAVFYSLALGGFL